MLQFGPIFGLVAARGMRGVGRHDCAHNRIACPSCEVEFLGMQQPAAARKAQQYGIRSVPAVVVDGKLADCCAGRGPDETALRAAGIGAPL